ncbi:TetR/AcrR family transcriptional regulator C-terminal domain-containing protein [Nocardia aurea]|uniref:TetR/AcrR family transcriptional regulator C-terminal domain-containing protein n=1 Tax=Nocardia aurea TaxID=2144174 RepID=UPI0033B33583
MPRPRSLTTADLAAAALAVIDRDGLAALTMRAVAQELRMATMALYRYVADREQLEVLVVDLVMDPLDLSLPAGTDWRDRLSLLLHRMRDAVAAHPETVPLVLRHRQASVATMRYIETTLAVLTDGGFDGSDRVIAQRAIISFLLGFLQNEHYASLRGQGTAAMAAMSTEEFPLLVRTAGEARSISVDDEFRGGVEIVLRGLRPPD